MARNERLFIENVRSHWKGTASKEGLLLDICLYRHFFGCKRKWTAALLLTETRSCAILITLNK